MLNIIKNKFNIRLVGLIPYIIGASLFIITPVILLLIKASEPADTFDKSELLTSRPVWKSIGISTYMGIFAALISLIILFPFTWFISRTKSKVIRTLAISLIVSPLFIFSVVKVFSLKVLLLRIYDERLLPQEQWIIVLGMIYLYSPYMIIPLYSVMRTFPENLLEASNDLGNNKAKSILKIVFPYCLKAIFSGIAVVFMLSATTLVMSNTLIDSGTASEKTRMIGNLLDETGQRLKLDNDSAIRASTIALLTIIVMMSVYGIIYLLPQLYRKFRGGVNV